MLTHERETSPTALSDERATVQTLRAKCEEQRREIKRLSEDNLHLTRKLRDLIEPPSRSFHGTAPGAACVG